MSNFWARRGSVEKNQLTQSCSELLGIAEGLLADGKLCDAEIQFLSRWLDNHGPMSCEWPGDVIHSRVKEVLADGVVTETERASLVNTLTLLVGGRLEQIDEQTKVNALAFDEAISVVIGASRFCLSGEFVMAPRQQCERLTEMRGGILQASVTKKLNYLVVGGLGSDEWKHGSFGTKITKAVEYQRAGCPIAIIHETAWAAALSACSPVQ
jgi:NAD-dependent DNA ligase